MNDKGSYCLIEDQLHQLRFERGWWKRRKEAWEGRSNGINFITFFGLITLMSMSFTKSIEIFVALLMNMVA